MESHIQTHIEIAKRLAFNSICTINFFTPSLSLSQANASVQVDASDPWGILITNGEFTAFVDPQFGTQVFIYTYS